MKKIVIFSIVSIILLSLISCSKSVILNTPQNLRVEDNCLLWDSVPFAGGYSVNFNEKDYLITDNILPFTITELKEYVFKVRATGDNSNYLDSSTAELKFIPKAVKLPSPKISPKDGSLIWDAVENASSYKIIIRDPNDEFTYYEIEKCSYSIHSELIDGIYTIMIKAISNNQLYLNSDYSEYTFEIESCP